MNKVRNCKHSSMNRIRLCRQFILVNLISEFYKNFSYIYFIFSFKTTINLLWFSSTKNSSSVHLPMECPLSIWLVGSCRKDDDAETPAIFFCWLQIVDENCNSDEVEPPWKPFWMGTSSLPSKNIWWARNELSGYVLITKRG